MAACAPAPTEPATFQGYVEADLLYLASSLGGRLQVRAVDRGDSVREGDLLFELESDEERAQLNEAKNRLARAEASEAFAQTEQQRADRLAAQRVVSEQTVDRARTELRTSEAEQAAAAAALDQIQWRVDNKVLRAPASGTVFDTFFDPGEWVSAGSPVLAILPPAELKVRFFVPQPALAEYPPGTEVEVRVDGHAEPIRGRVTFVAPEAEFTPPVIFSEQTRDKLVFMIEADVHPSDVASVRIGQPVAVRRQP